MLKDLPFYEVANLADSEARQACLEEREKKCQKGILKQTSVASHPISTSTVHSPTQKKMSMTRPIQKARTSPLATSSSSSLFSSYSSDEVEVGVKWLVPPIICEEEEEEEMATNLKFGFCER